MKNYFKKFSIMFVMLLTVIGVGLIQNGTAANAATIGQTLSQPENGWKRIDYTNKDIKYNGSWIDQTKDNEGMGTKVLGDSVEFIMHSKNIRIIGLEHPYMRSSVVNISIDGIPYNFSTRSNALILDCLEFEKLNLPGQTHKIKITNMENLWYEFINIDIDKDGYLVNLNESITLDKSSMDLKVGDSKQLTATTTPAGLGITWTSSDSNVAEYDLAIGKVIAKGVGTCTITATTVNGLTATCTVTVTKGDEPQPPVNGDANLFIELVDGQIKSYSVSNDEIAKFKQWYIDRDSTKSNKPYYEFAKGTYKDYVIHDKIDWFEVR
ncbi:bacterial Ig-like domain protein [Clostridium puniceum]|uniref:Bacterial Ig-like domain protein n=1 Tax=Clostridium puniceum TaxID=29367 RepID=A0A1S8TWM2_9CLOT|nr:Ig-like domain-containing protein [Clostridium puniceum]OOM82124.1 bacterial Ig-like domain protein [Clostridium puniceum]